MRTPIALSLSIGIVLVTLCQCGKDSNPVTGSLPDPLIPMAVGNRWINRVSVYDTSGNPSYSYLDTSRIYRDTLISNEVWFDFFEQGLRQNRADGVWLMTWPSPILQFPTLADSSSYLPWDSSYIKLLSRNTTITVPKGTFVCYEYSHIYPSHAHPLGDKYFIARKVGIVKREIYNLFLGTLMSSTELTDFQLN